MKNSQSPETTHSLNKSDRVAVLASILESRDDAGRENCVNHLLDEFYTSLLHFYYDLSKTEETISSVSAEFDDMYDSVTFLVCGSNVQRMLYQDKDPLVVQEISASL